MKDMKYGTVEFRPFIKFPLEYANVWSCENVDKMLALFDDYARVDFDDRHDLGAMPDLCTTQFNITSEFAQMGIIERQEDEIYYRGDNYEDFRACWEALKASKKAVVPEEIEDILRTRCLIQQQDATVFNEFLGSLGT